MNGLYLQLFDWLYICLTSRERATQMDWSIRILGSTNWPADQWCVQINLIRFREWPATSSTTSAASAASAASATSLCSSAGSSTSVSTSHAVGVEDDKLAR